MFCNDVVTRFSAVSATYGMDMLIDINTDIYPIKANERFTLVLANTLYRDNRPDPGVYKDYSKEVNPKIWSNYCRKPSWMIMSIVCTEKYSSINIRIMVKCISLDGP